MTEDFNNISAKREEQINAAAVMLVVAPRAAADCLVEFASMAQSFDCDAALRNEAFIDKLSSMLQMEV